MYKRNEWNENEKFSLSKIFENTTNSSCCIDTVNDLQTSCCIDTTKE